LEIFLFIVYIGIFLGLLYTFHVEKNTGFGYKLIASIFLLKVIAGCINLYIHQHEYISNDVTYYQKLSIIDLRVLQTSPQAFFNEWLFNWGSLLGHMNFLQKGNMTPWNNLGTLFHIKFMTLSNIFSFGHLYVNVIFCNVMFFVGQLALYKSFYMLQPQKKYIFLFAVFFIPSVMFWCSGIHKDGWLLSAIGFLVYFTTKYLNYKQFKYLLLFILALIFILIARYFYFICLLPPFIMWLFSHQSKRNWIYFIVCYVLAGLLFFNIKHFSTSFDPMQLIVNRQQEFIQLRGYSDMQLPKLSNTINSFIEIFPTALNHILVRPSFALTNPIKYNIAFLDAYFVMCLILLNSIYWKRKNNSHTLLFFLLFLSITVYLFIGYTVPNAGALVRYKSLFTALLLPTLFAFSEITWLNKCLAVLNKK
jgi:hypothetical protein